MFSGKAFDGIGAAFVVIILIVAIIALGVGWLIWG